MVGRALATSGNAQHVEDWTRQPRGRVDVILNAFRRGVMRGSIRRIRSILGEM